MGMDRSFPFISTLNSLTSFLTRYNIDLEKWCEMVLEFNSRTQVLLSRIEVERILRVRNGVWWVSLGLLVGFAVLTALVRGVVFLWVWVGSEKVEVEDEVKENEEVLIEDLVVENDKKDENEEILVNGDGDGHTAESKDDTQTLVNGNGATRENSAEILALWVELQATRKEIARLLPLKKEADGLRSQLELLIKGAKHQEQDREVLEKRIHESSAQSERLMEIIKTKDIEIGRLQPFKSEANELRFNLESCRAEVEGKEKALEAQQAQKAKVELELEAAYKEFEIVTHRAAESCEIEAKLRSENSELTKQLGAQSTPRRNSLVLKAQQEIHDRQLSNLQLAHEDEIQSLKEEHKIKLKEAKEGARKRPDSVASSSFTDVETSPGGGRMTPTRLFASLKRHSRSSLPKSINGSFTSSDSREQKNGK